jgi:hypothetical protein
MEGGEGLRLQDLEVAVSVLGGQGGKRGRTCSEVAVMCSRDALKDRFHAGMYGFGGVRSDIGVDSLLFDVDTAGWYLEVDYRSRRNLMYPD